MTDWQRLCVVDTNSHRPSWRRLAIVASPSQLPASDRKDLVMDAYCTFFFFEIKHELFLCSHIMSFWNHFPDLDVLFEIVGWVSYFNYSHICWNLLLIERNLNKYWENWNGSMKKQLFCVLYTCCYWKMISAEIIHEIEITFECSWSFTCYLFKATRPRYLCFKRHNE